eukprot:COSAG04_NODE_544_length_12827_cov_262.923421_9_plen_68_part_00
MGLVGVALSHNSLMIPTSRNAMDGPAMPDGGASSPWTLDGVDHHHPWSPDHLTRGGDAQGSTACRAL